MLCWLFSIVHGSKDNLLNRFFISYLPLNGQRSLEYFFDNCSVAGIVEGGHFGASPVDLRKTEMGCRL